MNGSKVRSCYLEYILLWFVVVVMFEMFQMLIQTRVCFYLDRFKKQMPTSVFLSFILSSCVAVFCPLEGGKNWEEKKKMKIHSFTNRWFVVS